MVYSRIQGTPPRAKFRAGELRAHVLLLQRLDCIPVEVAIPDNILDRALEPSPADSVRKAPGIEEVRRQERERFAISLPATLKPHATHLYRHAKDSTHRGRRAKTRGMHMRPSAAAVSSLEWSYKDVCQIQSPCEMPERQIHAASSPVCIFDLPNRPPENPFDLMDY